MSTPLLVAIGFGAGLAVALVFQVILRRRGPAPPPRPQPVAAPPKARAPVTVPPTPSVEREVAAVWLQFLRREVADTVSAINTRLAVVKTLLAELQADLSPGMIERIGVEVDRAAAATDTLHTHVSSTAPERAVPSIMATDLDAVRDGVVLLVESDDTTRDVLSQLFSRLGHRVLSAQNGIEALALLEREPVECVISETRASNVSGPALHAQVEERMPHLARRFVFISGDTQVPEVREFLDRCNCHVIPKPFNVALLVGAVNEVLGEAARMRNAQEEARRVRGPTAGASEPPA
ncbi:MAG: response regulator [Gemmatimonadota bacterium]|nr:response regulator [Gemmatimonadota bacterium]MDH4350181.1 response regulator [Gemmatimonadota bacterium]MDH5198249.1 response regulator [Gemmatimonadota bacterium]